MVICLEQGADLHMAQLMPLPLIVSCFSKIQIGFAFLVPAHPGSPGQRAVKRVCVCVCVCVRDAADIGHSLPACGQPMSLCHYVRMAADLRMRDNGHSSSADRRSQQLVVHCASVSRNTHQAAVCSTCDL